MGNSNVVKLSCPMRSHHTPPPYLPVDIAITRVGGGRREGALDVAVAEDDDPCAELADVLLALRNHLDERHAIGRSAFACA